METEKQKSSSFKAQFNSLEINKEDTTIIKGKVIVHGFDQSWNGQIITEEVCTENMSTLIGKRIVCKYISAEDNNNVDALGSHEEIEGKDRQGNSIIITDTLPIGFIENVYIDNYTDENNIVKRVLWADVVLWNDDKYANVIELLQDWLNRGIKIHMSVEYLYKNYNFIDGIEYVQSPIIYVAHTLLNSEDRGECVEILPAYDESQLTSLSLNVRDIWNKAISQLIKKDGKNNIQSNNNNQPIADVDINNKTNNQKEDVLMAENENNIEENVEVCPEKVEVVEETKEEIVEKIAEEVKKVDNEMDSLNAKINEQEEIIKTLNSTIETLTLEKETISNKLTESTNSISDLSKQINEMTPIVETYNKDLYEKLLNQQKTKYEEKFVALNAKEKFESKEVQDLIIKSLNENEVKEAILSLNSMLVDLVKPAKPEVKPVITEPTKSLNNLINVVDNFESRYFV